MERPLDTPQVVAMVLGGVAGAVLALAVPVVGIPIAGFALASLAAGGRTRTAVATAVVAAAAAALLAPASAIYLAPALLLAGPVAVWAVERHSAVLVVAGLTLALFVASVGSDAVALAMRGESIVGEAHRAAAEAARVLEQVAARTGDASTARVFQAQVQSMSNTVFMLWPSGYFEMAAFTALLVVLAAVRAALARGVEVNNLPRLAELDVSVHVVWFVVASMLLLAGAVFLGEGAELATAVGANVLLAVRLPLLAQGMGVASAAIGRTGMGRVGRAAAYAALLLLDLLFYVVSFVGLADMWINFRRLPRGQGGTRTPGPASG